MINDHANHHNNLIPIVLSLRHKLKTEDAAAIAKEIQSKEWMATSSNERGAKLVTSVKDIIEGIKVGRIKDHFTNPVGDQKGKAEAKVDWKALQIINEPPEEPPLITIGESPIATAGNHSQIIGKKKSRKSLLITWLISQYKGDASKDVMLFDTEQGKRHVWKAMERIRRLTGHSVGTFYLRGKTPQERRDTISAAIAEYATRPKVVIIDGIRDLLSNINDPDQVSEVVTWLERLTLEHGIHVMNILHMNKNDNNARGHLGSELLNKAEVTIELELDEKAGCTVVRCESSRDLPFEPFAFRHDGDGLPELVDLPVKGVVMSEKDRRIRLHQIFDGETNLKYKELLEGVRVHFTVGERKAKSLISEMHRDALLIKTGKDRSPDTRYKQAL